MSPISCSFLQQPGACLAVIEAFALVADDVEEVMMILWGHSTRPVSEMFRKVPPHLLLSLRPSRLRVIEIGGVAAHETVLATPKAQ